MDDRVGDILARRARLENGAGAAIFFSLLFHAMLTAIAGWSAWHHGTTQSTSVMTIRFAQPQPVAEMTSVGPPPQNHSRSRSRSRKRLRPPPRSANRQRKLLKLHQYLSNRATEQLSNLR